MGRIVELLVVHTVFLSYQKIDATCVYTFKDEVRCVRDRDRETKAEVNKANGITTEDSVKNGRNKFEG